MLLLRHSASPPASGSLCHQVAFDCGCKQFHLTCILCFPSPPMLRVAEEVETLSLAPLLLNLNPPEK